MFSKAGLFLLLVNMAAAATSASTAKPGGDPPTTKTSWASQLKHKRKSSCEDENERNQHSFTLLHEIVTHCDQYPADIGIIHNTTVKQKKKHLAQEKASEILSTQFPNFSTMKTLEEDFVMCWVLDNSDLSADDLIKARGADKDAAYLLAVCATQIPLSFKLPEDLNSKEIMAAFMSARNSKCGRRLQNFKRDGGLLASGKLNFRGKSFVLVWEEGSEELKFIQHVSNPTAIFKKSPGAWLNKKCDFEHFWDDHAASARAEGLPKVALHTIFGKFPNKFGYSPANSKNIDFKNDIAEVVQEHCKKAEELKKGSQASPLKGDLAKLDKAASKEKMQQVQEKMLAKINEKRLKRKLDFGDEPLE